MRDDLGKAVDQCSPGLVVETTGWKTPPQVGEMVLQATSNHTMLAVGSVLRW